jgi:hypothetical protein
MVGIGNSNDKVSLAAVLLTLDVSVQVQDSVPEVVKLEESDLEVLKVGVDVRGALIEIPNFIPGSKSSYLKTADPFTSTLTVMFDARRRGNKFSPWLRLVVELNTSTDGDSRSR